MSATNIHRIIRVEFELALPADANEAQVREWIEFELGYLHQMKQTNPLRTYDLESISAPVLSDTRQRLYEREVILVGVDGTRGKTHVSERIPVIEEEDAS